MESSRVSVRAVAALFGRHSGSLAVGGSEDVRHSGRWKYVSWPVAAALALPVAPAAVAQVHVDLREGATVVCEQVRGGGAKPFELVVDGRKRTVAAAQVLAVRVGPVRAVDQMRVELVGGERLFATIRGGDELGDRCELQSPVLGQVAVAVDRLAALVAPRIDTLDLRLPDGLDEGVFVPTPRGYDLLAGTLHRFGPDGVRFEPERAAPRWFAPTRFAALLLRGGFAREEPAPCLLATRVGDRLGVQLVRAEEGGLLVRLEGGHEATLRWSDVGCVVFSHGVVHLSSLQPVAVRERSFDGPVSFPWQRDRCAVGFGELQARGTAFGRGIGAHAISRLSFRVPEGVTGFRTRVAIDDSAGALPMHVQAVARVLRDNEVLFEVDDLAPGAVPRDTGVLPVEVGDLLTLEVDAGGGLDLGDRVDWLLPVFLLPLDS